MATATPRAVALRYFAALDAHDLDEMCACWLPGGRERIRSQIDVAAPEGVREYFAALFAAMPDFRIEVVALTVQKDRAVVRWEARGTFATGEFGGIAATATPVVLEGIDELTVRDGLIAENNAFADMMGFARQIGLLPPDGSRADRAMLRAANFKTRLARRLSASGPEPIADGVWLVRGGLPSKTMNVYLVRDGDGVLAFDAGISAMAGEIRAAAAQLGGLTRVVLGHAHADHRGAAPALGVDVLCHAADRADAEGDGGAHYFDLGKLKPHGRLVLGRLLPRWDGGPVPIAGTVAEGDEVAAGFQVVHLPGHAPGLIGLWRESDRVALVTDAFYTLDPQTGIKGHARVAHAAFNQDTEQARASIRKLAALRPSVAWPGHADPVRGDVATTLERAAATT
jgi:glyoxylase-like metal-dependent hydrolase (beta-lactamase superfamily II)/predicted ester cyclase